VRCSVIALAAEVRIYKLLSKETGGTFNVILDDTHLQDLMNSHVEPPPVVGKYESSLIKMGFPQRNEGDQAGMCICHSDDPTRCKFVSGGYSCPQCKNKYCELPVECKVCGLTLVSAPHLARSFLHIFPLDPFEEVPAPTHNARCMGCDRGLMNNKHVSNAQILVI